MTPEEKGLLLKDLCTRLPYGIIVSVTDGTIKYNAYIESVSYKNIQVSSINDSNFTPYTFYKISEIKPYLRPLSSITKEEKKEINNITSKFGDRWFDSINPTEKWNATFWHHSKIIDYLNSIHVDYRGLIEKGLAIEVTAENNPYKS